MDCPAVRMQTEALSSPPCPNISSSSLLSVNVYPFPLSISLSFISDESHKCSIAFCG